MGDPDRSDVDAQFAEIIAHWSDDALTRPGPAPWPDAEGMDEAEDQPRPPGGTPDTPGGAPTTAGGSTVAPPPTAPPGPLEPPSAAAPAAPPEGPARPPEPARHVDDPEEHFHPGPTQPLPAGDLQFWGIVIGLTGGPLLLLYLTLFDRTADSLWLLLAIGLTVGGFAMLVSRLPRHRDGDDDDDGAVV